MRIGREKDHKETIDAILRIYDRQEGAISDRLHKELLLNAMVVCKFYDASYNAEECSERLEYLKSDEYPKNEFFENMNYMEREEAEMERNIEIVACTRELFYHTLSAQYAQHLISEDGKPRCADEELSIGLAEAPEPIRDWLITHKEKIRTGKNLNKCENILYEGLDSPGDDAVQIE